MSNERTAHLGSGSTKTDRIYISAKADLKFRDVILTADGDKLPFWPNTMERAVIAGIYYGYLVAKYGDDWYTHI